ncbi:MAG: hypothetical protein Q4D04_10905 [Clostridia bacterium]|nr:hypothetical protein [Clostridia bacterium]
MHLVIINCSPRPASKSNTEKVLGAFRRGFEQSGNTCEVWHLSSRKEWEHARKAFHENGKILFALPLFVENIPGIMLEFLESLGQKAHPGTKVSFLIQGGFEEAVQAQCAKAYVSTLPAYFNCDYAGTLTKGGLFGANFLPESIAAKIIEPFEAAGREFAKSGGFTEEYAIDFAGSERMSRAEIVKYELLGCHLSKFMMGRVAKKFGCREKLDARPYQQDVR